MWYYGTTHLFAFLAVLASLSCHVTCRADDDCKFVYLKSAGSVGQLTNANYPKLSSYFSERCWVINMPPKIFMHHYIQVTKIDLDLHVPGDCAHTQSDFIEFREGQSRKSPLVGRWCAGWDVKEKMTSCTADMMILLHLTERSIQHRGFNVSYTTIKRDNYDCYTRAPSVHSTTNAKDGAIAGIAIFLLLSVLVIAVVVIMKTKEYTNNPGPRTNPQGGQGFWLHSAFDHRRFENESGAEELNVPSISGSGNGVRNSGQHQRGFSTSSQVLSESMRSSKPLPIGIPRGTYRADGFPAGYASACSIPEINIHDVDLGFVADDNVMEKQHQPPVDLHQVGNVSGRSDVEGENPLYELSFPDSGLPASTRELPVLTPDTLITASVPATTSGVELGMALEERLSGNSQGYLARSAPEVADHGVITLSFNRGNAQEESFA